MNRRRKSCYRPYEGKRWPLWRKAVLALLLAGALAFGALFGAVMYGAYDHIQGEPRLMVILGCQVKPWGPSILLQDRLDKALDYLEEHPDIPAVLTGGTGYGEEISEARCMYDWLTARGVDPDRLILEEQAEDTSENFALARPLLEEAGVDPARDAVAVVTNDFHIARARLIAQKKGYGHTVGVPAPLPWLHLEVNYFLREAFAMVKSLVFD